jgi:hypothetical protein
MLNPREIAALRGRARTRVIRDVNLSTGARLLYFYLDDEGRGSGETPLVTQVKLARVLGVSVRSIRDWFQELALRAYVEERRHSHGSVVALAWAAPAPGKRPAKSADHPGPERQILPITAAKSADHLLIYSSAYFSSERTLANSTLRCACGSYLEELPEEAVRCFACNHCHYPGGACDRCVPTEPIEEGAALLAAYVEQCGLPWAEPDVEIVQRSLDAAGGLGGLYRGLRFLLLERRAKPRQSYAWFPVVLATLRRTARTA